jgi:hypothetical protein
MGNRSRFIPEHVLGYENLSSPQFKICIEHKEKVQKFDFLISDNAKENFAIGYIIDENVLSSKQLLEYLYREQKENGQTSILDEMFRLASSFNYGVVCLTSNQSFFLPNGIAQKDFSFWKEGNHYEDLYCNAIMRDSSSANLQDLIQSIEKLN